MKENNNYSSLQKIIYRALGGTPFVHRMESEKRSSTKGLWDRQLSFDILTLKESPQQGVATCSTLGLSSYELKNTNNTSPVRIELLSVLREDTDFEELTEDATDKEMFFEEILFYLACYLVNEKDYIVEGDTWVNLFTNKYQAMYDNSDMEHIIFMAPKLLSNKIKTLVLDNMTINWLLCVPISEAELQYRENKGPEALMDLLLSHEVDVANLFRKSIV